MGMDISYHPVDVKIFQESVLGYLLGKLTLDGMIQRGTQIAKNRHRAEVWAYAVNDAINKSSKDLDSGASSVAPGGAGSPSSAIFQSMSFEFDTDLYIWGRPFFITVQDQNSLSESIDTFLNCDSAEADVFLRRMTDVVAPGLSSLVSPEPESLELDDDGAEDRVFADITALRSAFDNLATRKPVLMPDGEQYDPLLIVNSNLPLSTVKFAAHFRPGWMARGYVWPTKLLRDAGLPTGLFTTAVELFGPVLEAHPEIAIEFCDSIDQNWMLGGYLRPESVSAVRNFIEQNIEAIVKPTIEADWDDYCHLCLRKIIEALRDAEARGFGFLEATEIYEPFGFIN